MSDDRACGSQGVDEDGHCKRCGLIPGKDAECPPGFLDAPVTYCDGCYEPVDFPRETAKIIREIGGMVLCTQCKPISKIAPS